MPPITTTKRSLRFDPIKVEAAISTSWDSAIQSQDNSLLSEIDTSELQKFNLDYDNYFHQKLSADVKVIERKIRAAMTTVVHSGIDSSSKITVKWDESKLADVIYFARGEEERACEALKFNDDDYDVAELADFRREMHQYNAEKLKNDVKIIESQYIAAMMKINYQPEQSTADTTESGDVAVLGGRKASIKWDPTKIEDAMKGILDTTEKDVDFVSKLVFDEEELAAFRKDMHEYNQENLRVSAKNIKGSIMEVMIKEDIVVSDSSTLADGQLEPLGDDFALSSGEERLPMPGAWL